VIFTKYNFFKLIFVAESALPTRQPPTISLSFEYCFGCRIIRPNLPEAAAVAFFYGTNKTMPSSYIAKCLVVK